MSSAATRRARAKRYRSQLLDWRWRFHHLYWIKPADKKKPALIFKPRPEQLEILELIYEKGHVRLAILKARQLGFSTLLSLICLDWMLFRPGVNIAIVDLTAEKAEEKLAKVDFAWGKLPDRLKRKYWRTWRKNMMTLKLRKRVLNPDTGKREPDARRVCRAGKRARGDTFHLLWISEWGPIQLEDSRRSDEIADGALPAADKGLVVVETTWRGGKSGRLWTEVVEHALQVQEKHRTLRDWKVCFFAWWLDPTLVWEGSTKQIVTRCNEYLDGIEEKIGFKLSRKARLWYFKSAWPKRHRRYEEYPSVMEEMFMSQMPGAIYREEMAELRADGRLTRFKLKPSHRVFASFDLGRNDSMPCCLIQVVGKEVRVLDYYTNHHELVDHYIGWLKSWAAEAARAAGIKRLVGVTIVLPHDARHENLVGPTVEEKVDTLIQDCPGWEVVSVDRTPTIWDGIQDVRAVFPYVWMHAPDVEKPQDTRPGEDAFPSLVECLDGYHEKTITVGRAITREPIHDIHSHGADSFRTFCEGFQKGILDTKAQGRKRRGARVITGHGVLDDMSTKSKSRKRSKPPPPRGGRIF